MYRLSFFDKWDEHFEKLPPDIKVRVLKKLEKMKEQKGSRHLQYGIPIFVEEVGQYRICYKEDLTNKIKQICFVGNHKEYDKWNHSFKKRPYR
jgi:mRNA-degrading endonuclease RelE of RelBE toxin-antitoxin system